MQNKITKTMLRKYPPPLLNSRSKKPNFKQWSLSEESINLYKSNPNAFFIAAIFDRAITADKAWEIPYQLKKRLGHLNVYKLSKMTKREMISYLSSKKYGPTLHRFYPQIAECLIFDCKLLVSKYHGDARNIWQNDPNAKTVIKKLREFRGIGQKIANMFVRLLVTYYGVKLVGWEDIDIPVDRHVARVFLRTGLITSENGKIEYSIPEIRYSIIQKARELYPKYPAALDEPAFVIGREWCTESEALCDYYEDYEPCPLSNVCTKRKRHYKIISN